MITPRFTVTQDEEFLHIDISISQARFNATNIEMVVDDNLFIFSLAPYYLRLRFAQSLVDDERAKAKLNALTEQINISIPKLNKGEQFEDLDLHAKLLLRSNEIVNPATLEAKDSLMTEISTTRLEDGSAESTARPQLKPQNRPLIEELDAVPDLKMDQDIDEAEDFNWEIEQHLEPPEDINLNLTLTKVKYGFNNQYDSVIGVSLSNGNDINGLADPEHTSLDQRIMERLIKENIKFDHEYYAADYIMEKHPDGEDDKRFELLLNWKNPVTSIFLKHNRQQQQLKKEGNEAAQQPFPSIEFTQQEQDQMLNLPKRTYLVDQPLYLHYTVLSLLFGYCFDLRENEGDNNTESAWTVGKLAPQISMLDSQIVSSEAEGVSMLKSVVITMTRRALCFPLHRNYELIMKTWDDVYYQLRAGKRYVLRNLLAVRELFRYHDVYYVYCKILLDDLLAWFINDVGENLLRSLAHELRKTVSAMNKREITFEKVIAAEDNEVEEMVALDLAEIEEMANEMYAEQFGA